MNNLLLKCFIIANSSNYCRKDLFYKFKNNFLPAYGIRDGKDVQIIQYKCSSCDGTGRFHYWYDNGGELCNRCNGTGRGKKKTFYLLRYRVNEHLFHIPTYSPPEFGDLRNTITGKTKHKDHRREAGRIAFYILIFWYNRQMLIDIWKSILTNKFNIIRRCIYYKIKWFKNPHVSLKNGIKIEGGIKFQLYKLYDLSFEKDCRHWGKYESERTKNYPFLYIDTEIGFGIGAFRIYEIEEEIDPFDNAKFD